MTTPIREQLLSAITTAVSGVYDVPAPEDERDAPMTVVADDLEQSEVGPYGEQNIVLPVTVARAEIASGPSRDVMRGQAHEMLADLILEMFADETFGGLADGVEYVSGGIQTEVGKFIFAEAQFSVRYHTVRGNPYLIDEV